MPIRKMILQENKDSVLEEADFELSVSINEPVYEEWLKSKEEILRLMATHTTKERDMKRIADSMPRGILPEKVSAGAGVKFNPKNWKVADKLTSDVTKPSSGLYGPKRKKKKMYNMPLLEDFGHSFPLHLPPHDPYFRDAIEDAHILLTKEHDNSAAELYFLETDTRYVLDNERWRNCSFLGFNKDGWIIFLEENGRDLFYLHVGHWISQAIPSLPMCLSPDKCIVLQNGWRTALRYDPRHPNNMIVMVGMVHFYCTNTNMLLLLYAWPNSENKWIIRTLNNFDMENMNVAEGCISGPVVLFLDDYYICWVCEGNRLVIYTFQTIQEVLIPDFLNGNLPVSMVVRPDRPEYIYLYQHRGVLHVPPLVVRVQLPNYEVLLLHHFPATFYMTDYGGGYTDRDGYNEEGELVQEIILIDYGEPGFLLTEIREEEEESSNTQGDGTSDSHGSSSDGSESSGSDSLQSSEDSNGSSSDGNESSENDSIQSSDDEESGESSNSEGGGGPQMENDNEDSKTSNIRQNGSEGSNTEDNGGPAHWNNSEYEDQTSSSSERGEGPQTRNKGTEISSPGQTQSEESSNTEGSEGPAHENSSEDEDQTSTNSGGTQLHMSSSDSDETEESTDDQEGNVVEDEDQEEEVVEASRDLYFANCASHHIDNYYTIQGVGLWRQLNRCENCRHSSAWFHS